METDEKQRQIQISHVKEEEFSMIKQISHLALKVNDIDNQSAFIWKSRDLKKLSA